MAGPLKRLNARLKGQHLVYLFRLQKQLTLYYQGYQAVFYYYLLRASLLEKQY